LSLFDELDERLSDAIDVVLAEPVIWYPMLRQSGGQYTIPANTPDPNRPISERLEAVISWTPTTEAVGENADQQGRVSTFAVMVDIDRREFSGYPSLPIEGDRFEAEEEPRASRWLEIRRVADDDSARLIYYCAVVKP
jgi:hypothetical protein